jgi:MFS family permease
MILFPFIQGQSIFYIFMIGSLHYGGVNLENYKVYAYRWVILLSMIPVLAVTNVFWLTFAPITDIAVKFYHVTPLSIALLSMSYMVIYIIMAIPASWVVDTKGFRVAMGIGAIVTAVFGMLRGIYAQEFLIVTLAQFGVAIGQPFLVNSITKVAARWFPVDERATASGIATLAGYLGMIAALVATPLLTQSYGMEAMMRIDGYLALGCAAIFLLFSKERPPIPPGPGAELTHPLNLADIKKLLHQKDFGYLLICLFVIMGIFNALMTWIEDVLKPKGITPAQAGIIGGMIVVIGITGAIILPLLSDKLGKRRPFLIWPIIAAIPGFAGLIFAADYYWLMAAAGIMGFFVMGMGPIAFQYGAEKAYPVPEGTSFGLLMMAGQVSGILFIYGMDALRSSSGEMTPSLMVLMLLMLGSFFLATRLRESELIKGDG